MIVFLNVAIPNHVRQGQQLLPGKLVMARGLTSPENVVVAHSTRYVVMRRHHGHLLFSLSWSADGADLFFHEDLPPPPPPTTIVVTSGIASFPDPPPALHGRRGRRHGATTTESAATPPALPRVLSYLRPRGQLSPCPHSQSSSYP